MSTITKERIELFIKSPLENGLTRGEQMELARIALASLEAEPLCYLTWHQGFRAPDDCEEYVVEAKPGDKSCDGTPAFPVYTAPPVPVSVPDAMEMDDDFDSAFEHGKAVGWNACRAAMLQGADVSLTPEGKNHHEDKLGMVNHLGDVTEKVEPVTQIEPVADLYGLTSPTGGETSFTFDAVEARDFIDGGWSCQEYVELERFQEAVSGNSPVIQDGWISCSERMPDTKTAVLVAREFDRKGDWRMKWATYIPGHPDANDGWVIPGASWIPSHWMPLPEPPQEVNRG